MLIPKSKKKLRKLFIELKYEYSKRKSFTNVTLFSTKVPTQVPNTTGKRDPFVYISTLEYHHNIPLDK